MTGKWPTVRLGDHIDSCLGKMLDGEKNRGEYAPYLGNKNVRWGRFDTAELGKMRFEEHEHDRYGLKYGDLIVCEGGEPGRCALWKGDIPHMKIQKALHRIRPYDQLDSRFLHYWFLLSGRNGALEPYFTGTTIKHLTGKALVQLEIPLPNLSEQKAIAHILGSLDDKIELNRQINKTLEDMAQALFKSWFVDFDPVIGNALKAGNPIPEPLQAKADARRALHQSGQAKPLPADIQALFPDAFTFTEEMGWVPEGWFVRPLTSVASFVNKSVQPNREPSKIWEHYSIPAFDKTRMPTMDTGESIKSGKFIVPKNSILVSKLNPETPRVWATSGVKDMSICSTELMPFVPCRDTGHSFLYGLLNSKSFQTEVCNRTTGSTGSRQRVKPPEVEVMPILLPEAAVIDAYSDQARGMVSRAIKTIYDNQPLAKLRDTLLPKLISGELRIPDAEKLVAEAGI